VCVLFPLSVIYSLIEGIAGISDRLLLFAIQKNQILLSRFPLILGVNPNFSLKGRAPFILAAKNKNRKMINLLLEHHANPDWRGWLREAVQNGDFDLAKSLVEHGANPNQVVDFQEHRLLRLTPPEHWMLQASYEASLLYIAIENRHYPLIESLLAHDANPNEGLYLLIQHVDDAPGAGPERKLDSSCWDLAGALGDEQIMAWLKEAKYSSRMKEHK
jgi:ankyrin repeat protein